MMSRCAIQVCWVLILFGISASSPSPKHAVFDKAPNLFEEEETPVTEKVITTTTESQEIEYTVGPVTDPDMDDIDVLNIYEGLTEIIKKYKKGPNTKRLKSKRNETRPVKQRKPIPPMYVNGRLNEAYLRRMSKRLYRKMAQFIVGKGNWRTLQTSFQHGQLNKKNLLKNLEKKMLSFNDESKANRTPYPKTILMNIEQAMDLVHFAAKVELLKLLRSYKVTEKCFWKGEGCPRTRKLERALHRDLREAVDVFQTHYVPQAFSWRIQHDLHVPSFSYVTITNFESESMVGTSPSENSMVEGKFEATRTGLYSFSFECLVEITKDEEESIGDDDAISAFICPNGCCAQRPYEIEYPPDSDPHKDDSENKTLETDVILQPGEYRIALRVRGALYLKESEYAAVYLRNKSNFDIFVKANSTTFLGYFVGKI